MTRIRFEDLPSTNTPINAENLNKLNNVIVSSEEPTTGEEVWLEKGKNLFDKNIVYRDCWINSSGGEDYSANSNDYISSYIECKANTSYTLSGYIGTQTNYLVICSYDKNYQYIEHIFAEVETTGIKTFVVEQDCYIRFAYGKGLSAINKVQLEQGEVATSYEPYITKKIHTKNDNGVYEEFYNEEEHNKVNYSTSEQRIGTWIDGKPLYRKVFEISNISGTDMNFGTGLTGINVVDIRGFLKSSDGSGSLPTPFILGEDYLYVNTTLKGAQIRIRTNDTWSGFILFVTLEYTK